MTDHIPPSPPHHLEDWIQYWFPFVGLELDQHRAWVLGRLLERPTYADWAEIERTDVARLTMERRVAEALGLEVHNTLPVCLIVLADAQTAPPDADALPIHALWPQAHAFADAVLYAMWLHKAGTVLPPESFGLYANSSSGMVTRQPGWYRQTIPARLEDGYKLTADAIPAVERLARLVARYRAEAANPSGDLALDNLRASYGWSLTAADRLIVLFAGLEAILGGYRAHDEPFGHVPMAERAAVAAAPQGAAPDEATQAFLAGRGRQLRNAVAHGTTLPDDASLLADVELLRDVLRRSLIRYLTYCAQEGEALHRDRSHSPMIAFNLRLIGAPLPA